MVRPHLWKSLGLLLLLLLLYNLKVHVWKFCSFLSSFCLPFSSFTLFMSIACTHILSIFITKMNNHFKLFRAISIVSLCFLLTWGAMDAQAYPEASVNVLKILWDIGTSQDFRQASLWSKARASAFVALASYEVDLVIALATYSNILIDKSQMCMGPLLSLCSCLIKNLSI